MVYKDKSMDNLISSSRVFIFEGIDHAGKSTIVTELSNKLKEMKIAHSTYSFPGKESRTVGALVNDLHHNQDVYFDKPIDALSLQMLHVAAHIDTINSRIIPDLKAGKVVLIDRFWWSTFAYGVANGIKRSTIRNILLPEKKALSKLTVAQFFLIRRNSRTDDYSSGYSKSVLETYEELGADVEKSGLLTIVDNDSDLTSIVDGILKKILSCLGGETNLPQQPISKDNLESESVAKNFTFFVKPLKIQPTFIYDAYWQFAVERQNIFFNRFHGAKFPWTDDPVLKKYKFTNTYRASDRVSQYLLKEVIYSVDQYSPEDMFFRIILFKMFNKIETWENLQAKLGNISYKRYRYEQYDQVLSEALNQKKAIYSAAYIMPSGKSTFGNPKKHQNNLRLLERMMNDHLAQKIATFRNMEQLYQLLLSYPTIGKFLAFQYCIDINYSEMCDFDEMSFVVAGPGATNGIRKCFQNTRGYSDEDIIKYVTESQANEFQRLGLSFRSLWGRPLQLIDCQNLFCETDKYSRVAFPIGQGATDRKRIKQLFTEHSIIDYFYPPKWNINQLIKRG